MPLAKCGGYRAFCALRVQERYVRGMRTITSLDELAGLVERSAQPLYLRWSSGPDDDLSEDACSEDSLTGVTLPGLSANPLGRRGLVARPPDEGLGRTPPL